MIIQVAAKYLITAFDNFVKNSKVMFNLKTDGSKVNLQMLGNFTAVTEFPCVSIDNDNKEIDASIWITKSIHVLSKDEPIKLTFTDNTVVIEQGSFYSIVPKEYEARRELPKLENKEMKSAFANRLKYLTSSVLSCNVMSKELSIPDPDPIFTNGKFYANYNQAFFIDNIMYPECCIPFNVMREFAYKLDENAVYCYLRDINTIYFKTKDYDFWVPTTNYNIDGSVIATIDKKLNSCIEVTKVCFKEFKDRLTICSVAFAKQKIVLTIGQGGFFINADSNDAHIALGNLNSKYILSLNITAGQLAAMMKLFGDEDEVEILRGGNYICLRCKEKNMLIAGMIY